MKREYRVCPRKFKCVWAEQSDDARFCMFSVCPYTAISDGARVVSPVRDKNAAEGRIGDLTSRCEDE